MKVTLLGTGDWIGMPLPTCNCKYCENGERRRRPALLVETGEKTLVFDLGPDIIDQLSQVNTDNIDAFFATHTHYDHFGGYNALYDLHQAGMDLTVYGSTAVKEQAANQMPWIDLPFTLTESDEPVTIGTLTVEPFPITHSDIAPMQGFTIHHDGKTVVYAPDILQLPAHTDQYKNPDIMFADGLYLFSAFQEDPDHAAKEQLRQEIEKVNADRVVLTNVTEHWHEMHTAALKDATEYEIWSDFDHISL